MKLWCCLMSRLKGRGHRKGSLPVWDVTRRGMVELGEPLGEASAIEPGRNGAAVTLIAVVLLFMPYFVLLATEALISVEWLPKSQKG